MIIEIENIKYHFEIKGEGKPIVCLHGFSENLSTWNLLELKGHQLILIDFIGHGESDKPYLRKYYSLKVIIKHLNKLIYQLNLKKYSMLGYSMGGRIALAYAVAYSQEIDKLILESSSYGEAGFINRFKRRRRDLNLAKNILKNGIEWFDEYWSNLSIFQSQRKLQKHTIDEIRKRRLSNRTYALSNTLLCTGQGKFPCMKSHISKLSMSLLYISGEYDKKYKHIGENFKEFNANIKHETMKGVGHNAHIEAPDAFIEVLSKFL
ncbi:2-succinyl-6-hydroxy-2,4-cyclohexadiene-1-carboxylate synthase [Clostridium pasteurianum DSM 525 = ATCC 6013]|uniref:Putative 2-succinyl-6-hydroxy-2,4-cyclohexadiene-1-carboxylate synthase n=1 Tax=Clostridium pasteurianum DSM 525 = ATCC 6013 TaxID=1262449 RepID=A0A0H3JAJ7_CLOPA|nr:2-succinyl-6-hydroxy-2,4-cyclohexadiene-1-carboxylate synthase [Clostridium pasteurianum]AJA48615.1 2-succinyl-6-hydroxy-2,4-cyclohexadiene-1-carboxylate synthase [Clostridium pasteurianum DSM 525 = ATCC 6013]AJA52603.1 2-succinyl-6-hydroxy-2,4-cyclohexadiene-1-carboxylate synthase [Clostridium pasteurianum DSM 525 = ATCC 6013]AOZ75845.1 2-succinyl-6-hydroxy-2,4-cyclohexadiene-1-carboxylate synthase [Clostridium pasteurianum DSM 525 = ATCC 6013]AOZ79641.1 2-succinyl-6-hydroxy-2,4-cyclohexadi